ncbi:hypothetical protein ISN45_Aa05g005930 [Arabidopsis thaliana x Arabidopsis arenosa]|uniref:Uncharacterized protein n=1 Tax=Arabidopsis thaliana x Arabidopsis arenosa TaxID=1240361 RepID=A0A8T1ZHP7_9BRAS|nr:hypothetical protein ISN45_Aa05g005930 [Arabidopsis thaliana x Arabidopsis arenosa]
MFMFMFYDFCFPRYKANAGGWENDDSVREAAVSCVLKSAPRPRLGSRRSEAKGSAPQTGEARRSPLGSRSGTPGLKARLNSLCASDRKSCASNGQGSEAPAPRLKAQTEHPSALPRLALFKTQAVSGRHLQHAEKTGQEEDKSLAS